MKNTCGNNISLLSITSIKRIYIITSKMSSLSLLLNQVNMLDLVVEWLSYIFWDHIKMDIKGWNPLNTSNR